MKKITCTLLFVLGFVAISNAQTAKKHINTKNITSLSKPNLANGKVLYAKHCVVCHQADGGGVMSLNPPLTKTEYVLGDPTRLINIILKGFNKEIEIDGDTYANPMPALAHLSDQQVADVLSFVRNNFGNKASVISPAQVKKVRGIK
jgi:mono/diheme cytochrome c family protein